MISLSHLQFFTDNLAQAKENFLRRLKNRHDAEKQRAKKNKTEEPPPWNQDEAIETTNQAFARFKAVDGKRPIFLTGAFFAPQGSLLAYERDLLKPVWMGDAAHMKHKMCGGIMMCYNALDANRSIMPMVIGVSPQTSEDVRSWTRCHLAIKKLYPELPVNSETGPENQHTFITDGQKGLESSIRAQFPGIHHHKCAFHVQQCIIKYFKGRGSSGSTPTGDFKRMVHARTPFEVGFV